MKHSFRIFNLSAIVIIIALFFVQCKHKKKAPTKVDPAFSAYIKAFPSGVISNESDIVIQLFEQVPGITENMEVDKKLLSFSPSIKGKAYWKNSQTIVFSPNNRLPSNKVYQAKFHLYKILQVPKNLKTLQFQFQTKKQAISIEFNGLKTYETDDLTRQMLSGKLITSDAADINQIEKVLSANQNNEKLNITWEHSGKTHTFVIENIARKKNKGEVVVTWTGSEIESADDGSQTIEIPPLGDFSVFDIKITQTPDQCITIYFSDPIDQKQEINGLVYLRNATNVRLIIKESSIKVYPVTRLKISTELIVEQGVQNVMGYSLKEKYTRTIEFSNIKPAVKLIGNGVILPNSNGLVFPFKAVNLNGVNVKIIKVFENNVSQFLQNNQFDGTREMRRVGRIVYKNAVPLTSSKVINYGKWNTFSLNLSTLIDAEPGAIYRVHLSFNRSQSLYPCTNNTEKMGENATPFIEDKEIAKYDEPYNGYYYYDDYDYYYGNYNWRERKNPCSDSYYMNRDNFVAQNILSSNMGIIVKGCLSNKYIVAITDLLSTQPLANVNVEIYNYQNQLMDKGVTNNDGLVTIPLSRKPFLLIAKKDKQRGYLRLDDGSALSLSMFDIGGQKNKKGVKGFIYGERGVWRPGDSIYLTFILEDKNMSLPKNHPVVFELYTPENQLYQRKVKTTELNSFYDFRTATKQSDLTGNWLVKIKVGGSTFSKYLKIETVKPNRLKIDLNFGTDILKKGETPQAKLTIKWLHGAIAKNLKADIELKLSEGKTAFKDFPDYIFDNPSKSFESIEKNIFNNKVGGNGIALIPIKISVSKNAPGMLSARFKTRAFEKGGDFSTDVFTMKYSPYKSYVGVKVPKGKGWNGALYSNEPNIIPIVTVNEKGEPISRKKVKIEVYKIYWRWWWEQSDDNDLARYVSNKTKNILLTDYVDTKNGKALYELNFNQNTWGRKLIVVTDPESGHTTGQLFYTSYKGWWNSSETDSPGGAEMLTFSTDKKTYNVGDKVNVELPASEQGSAFVSIESGSKVLKTFWVDIKNSSGKFSFKAEADMAPNVFLHITYIQPHNQTANDLPIRLYGVQPIGIENPKTHLQPIIEMPDILEPEKEVTIEIKEAQGKKMTYTIAVVDEGLLDLTRFTTPNAWSDFYSREALGVKTWDMYKYVIGAFTGEMAGLLALGGDEEIMNKTGKKANRFKPVVHFIGPIELSSGKNRHTFIMPNYVGSVKTMVVAANNGAYGKTEKTTPVKKPLMAIATLPRVIGPNESVQLPVTIFAMDEKIKNVTIKIETNGLFTIVSEKKKSVHFKHQGDETVNFNLKATKNIGVGKVKIIATCGKEKAVYNIELDVRLPNPRITKIIDAVIEPNKEWSSTYKAVGIKGTNNGVVEISSMPPINLEKRLSYLIRYPHGCIEQTTSSVFPQLYLNQLIDLDNDEQQKLEDNIKAGINHIKTFQLSSGGLTYWPGQSGHANDWGTNYGGHFMIEAQALGYSLPHGFIKNWAKYQSKRANDWSVSEYRNKYYYQNSSQLLQAYRLYTLALANKPAIGAMNRLREVNNLSLAAKWRLAAAYYLAGRKKAAVQLIENLKTNIDAYTELSYSYGSDTRDEAMILETLVLMEKKNLAKDVLKDLSDNLSSEKWYSTQTTAYALMAIAKFVGPSNNKKVLKYEVTVGTSKTKKVNTTAAVSQTKLNINEYPKGNISIKNSGEKMLFVKVQLNGIPLTGDATSSANGLKMEIRYLDLDENIIDPAQLTQGTDFIAEVIIQHPGIRNNYKEMALTRIFPSGWEIRNLRMEGGSSKFIKDVPQYEDIRDDRVYSYFDIKRNTIKTFRVLLNAAYIGKYYLPTVYCEAMYDNSINASIGGKWIEVIAIE